MTIKIAGLVTLSALVAACQSMQLPNSLSTDRVLFALDLKMTTATRSWPTLGDKRNEGTLIYFDGEQSEVFFADERVNSRVPAVQKYSDQYFTTDRLSNRPFHMEVMFSTNDADASAYFYNNPVEQYSSVEEVNKTIGSVESTEMWATMVVHEMFHHFQYNNQHYIDYAKSQIAPLPFDIRNLIALCQDDPSFLSMIRQENSLLMQAIDQTDTATRNAIIASYIAQRTKRIALYSTKHPHLEKVENYYTLQEGSARYIEYQSMFVLNERHGNAKAAALNDDPMFKSYAEFKQVNLQDEAFNYLVYAGSTDYHYTLGFNIMRL